MVGRCSPTHASSTRPSLAMSRGSARRQARVRADSASARSRCDLADRERRDGPAAGRGAGARLGRGPAGADRAAPDVREPAGAHDRGELRGPAAAARSAVSRFGMKIDGLWQEGEVVERQAARRIFEDFLHRRQDPALLEHDAGERFRARVFPIPANGRKELVITYSQELAGAHASYHLPLGGLPKLDALDVRVLGPDPRDAKRVIELYTDARVGGREAARGGAPRGRRSAGSRAAQRRPRGRADHDRGRRGGRGGGAEGGDAAVRHERVAGRRVRAEGRAAGGAGRAARRGPRRGAAGAGVVLRSGDVAGVSRGGQRVLARAHRDDPAATGARRVGSGEGADDRAGERAAG
jgi:hypothetical protein